jgi:hypothetical protein
MPRLRSTQNVFFVIFVIFVIFVSFVATAVRATLWLPPNVECVI